MNNYIKISGAMRKCFRAKKLGNFSMKSDWALASNVVCKQYLEDVDPEVLFEDITLQMEAKLWAGLYNKRGPPKKIDIMQICMIQMVDRPGQPYFQMEHYIEGNYNCKKTKFFKCMVYKIIILICLA